MKKNRILVFAVLAATLVLSACCLVEPKETYDEDFALDVCGERPVDSFDPSTGVVVCARWEQDCECEEEKIPTPTPLAPTPPACRTDPFGPEGHFPGNIKGPAIVELWNPETGFCALVKVNSDEELTWENPGSFFQTSEQSFLDARWPSYLLEYQAKSGNKDCKVFETVKDIPNPF